jgi:secreted trypsin-like serine protease
VEIGKSDIGGYDMTKKTWLTALLAVLLSLTIIAPALAIRYGEPDAERHPYVGLMNAYDGEGTRLWRCSGTLIAPQLFLTAGHCTEDPADHVEIWFDEDLTDADEHNYPFEGDVSGTPYTHPDYDPNAFFTHDLGVVVLDEPVFMDEYGQLPEEGQYDYLATQRGQVDDTFTAVGYGLQNANKNHLSAERLRLLAHPQLIVMNSHSISGDYSILMTNNAHTGGTCFGDSGGPLFFGDSNSNLLVGVTSYGLNSQCAGTGGVYRIDRADDLDWLWGEFGEYLEGYQ